MKGFMTFVREQGVVGLAVGIILGGAVSKLVASLVNDIINPVLGLILGAAGSLTEATLQVGPVALKWGSFVNSMIDFIVIAMVVYYGVSALGLGVWSITRNSLFQQHKILLYSKKSRLDMHFL